MATDIKKFLDQQGVSTLWSKIVDKVDTSVKAEADRAKQAEQANTNAIAALDTKVGVIPDDSASVIAYINKNSYRGNIMEISARNGLTGKVADVKLGEVMASIKIEVTEPGVITAVITRESAEELGLKEGDEVNAVIKSTEIMVAK